jgi:hypothetical protein
MEPSNCANVCVEKTLLLAREMTLTADQYSQIAAGYHKAAVDPSIGPEKRKEFARKAEWFRFLAERDKGTLHHGGTESKATQSGTDSSFEPSLSAPRRSLNPLLTTLWVTGAAVYLIGTLLFANTVDNPFSSEDKPKHEVTQPAASPGDLIRKEETARLQPAVPPPNPTPDKKHAVAPQQPSYEAPGLIVPPSATEDEHNTPTASPARAEQASGLPAGSSEPDVLKVHHAATIRNGPAATAKVIGTASPGAELQVKARENGWIQFVDLTSGNTGWIESHLVAPASPKAENSVAISEDAPSLTAQKPRTAPASPEDESDIAETRLKKPPSATREKPVRKQVRKKPNEPSEVAQQRPSRPFPPARHRAYADLPKDEEFLADTPPRRGFFARRRMLREGLMSRDFVPPR